MIWIYELTRKTLTRITSEWDNAVPVWAPNGLEIIYTSTRAGAWNLFQQSIDGSGAPKQLTTTGNEAVPNSFSADGKILIFQELSSDRSGSVAFVDGGRRGARGLSTAHYR